MTDLIQFHLFDIFRPEINLDTTLTYRYVHFRYV